MLILDNHLNVLEAAEFLGVHPRTLKFENFGFEEDSPP